MKFKPSPCYKDGADCPKRHKPCHETCPEFKEWRAELDADNKARRDATVTEYAQYIVPRIIERKKIKDEKENRDRFRKWDDD